MLLVGNQLLSHFVSRTAKGRPVSQFIVGSREDRRDAIVLLAKKILMPVVDLSRVGLFVLREPESNKTYRERQG